MAPTSLQDMRTIDRQMTPGPRLRLADFIVRFPDKTRHALVYITPQCILAYLLVGGARRMRLVILPIAKAPLVTVNIC